MIIVEGADNTGKTTLINKLISADPSLQLIRRSKFRPDRNESIGKSYFSAICPPGGDRLLNARTIADRLMASECIYGQLFRGGCRMSNAEHFALRAAMHALGTTVVLCDPGDDAIQRTWAEREQLYAEADRALEIARAYRVNAKRIFQGFPVRVYDYTKPDAEEFIRETIRFHQALLNTRRDAHTWWAMAPTSVGQLHAPKIVFIADCYPMGPHCWPNNESFAAIIERLGEDWPFFDFAQRGYYTTFHKETGTQPLTVLRYELANLALEPGAIVVTFGVQNAPVVTEALGDRRVKHLILPSIFHLHQARDETYTLLASAIRAQVAVWYPFYEVLLSPLTPRQNETITP